MSVLTRMALNPATRGGRKLLSNRQAMHAAVMSAFSPDAHDDMDGRILWRIDHDGHRHVLYMVSPVQPDLIHVVEQAGWLGQSWDAVSYDHFLGRLARGQRWGFRLTANPVRAVARKDARSKVVPHVTPAQQVGWLNERAAGWGFSLATPDGSGNPEESGGDHVLVSQRHDDRFGRVDGDVGRRRRVTLRIAQFDGVLEVTDAAVLRGALLSGMGRAKGYGCGLMTLRPVGG
ncbi:type I-E CRISPR-associated protein Cas6/Cse3/CasE [Micrococcus sp. EYE_162]|nr:type I-E CRISPR-associated protein Cas6/Cse3/CasE [Micrococcus sp. EYE_212]MCK6171668.1 type I-E CRISPR-associated protein Cas6/Cse3/CasE [Micrococcus sp. EYE_162]